jgi:hypothetical protein
MARFRYYNDPTSDIDFQPTFTIDHNTITYTGFTVINGPEPKSEIDLYEPFLWARLATDPSDPNAEGAHRDIPLTWNNRKDGWFTEDFDGTGTSLLVTLDIVTLPDDTPDGKVAAGKVASGPDLTSVFLLELASQHDGTLEVLQPGDKVPFANLGSFEAHQTKDFELVFTYHWGKGPHPDTALRVEGATFTIVPADQHDHAADARLDYLV